MDDDGVGTLWEGACNLRTFCAPTSTSALGAPQRRCCQSQRHSVRHGYGAVTVGASLSVSEGAGQDFQPLTKAQ